MGLYSRKDSPFHWMCIEGTDIRESTGIPIVGGSPQQERELRRQAQEIYAVRKAAAVASGTGITVRRPTISFPDFAAWYREHHSAHHRGATSEQSMVRRLEVYFGRYDSLALITEDAVKEWMTWRKRQVKPSTVNRELDVLKQMLKAAVPKYLAANPIAGLRRFRVEEAEPRILTRDEER